jgi:hypothetical protein
MGRAMDRSLVMTQKNTFIGKRAPTLILWFFSFAVSYCQACLYESLGASIVVFSIVIGASLRHSWHPLWSVTIDGDVGIELSHAFGRGVRLPWASVVGSKVYALRGNRASLVLFTLEGAFTLVTDADDAEACRGLVLKATERAPLRGRPGSAFLVSFLWPALVLLSLNLIAWALRSGDHHVCVSALMALASLTCVLATFTLDFTIAQRRRERWRGAPGAPPYR